MSKQVCSLRAQSLDVLRTLFARRSEVVTRQALFDAVRSDHVVTDNSLVVVRIRRVR